MNKKIIFLIFIFLKFCTYSLKPPLPYNIKNIGVESFSNSSERLGIETFVTQSFIEAILEDRRIPIKDPDKSDLIIKGEITRYTKSTFGIIGYGEVFSYKVIIKAKIKFIGREGKEVFESVEFQGESIYDTREKTEEEAIKEAARDLSRKVIQHIYAQGI
ncbi:MAG: LPS assembly lipoprotein LptE [Candidatus Hydrothermales bacterium]